MYIKYCLNIEIVQSCIIRIAYFSIVCTLISVIQCIIYLYVLCLIISSLLSSCSSFRDSTFDDQGQANENDEGGDLNGITKRFKGIIYNSV